MPVCLMWDDKGVCYGCMPAYTCLHLHQCVSWSLSSALLNHELRRVHLVFISISQVQPELCERVVAGMGRWGPNGGPGHGPRGPRPMMDEGMMMEGMMMRGAPMGEHPGSMMGVSHTRTCAHMHMRALTCMLTRACTAAHGCISFKSLSSSHPEWSLALAFDGSC